MQLTYDKRRSLSTALTICAVDERYESRQPKGMLDKKQLLTALRAKGVKNVDVERVLGLESSRVTEIFRAISEKPLGAKQKARDLSYDEGVKLVDAFGLEPSLEVAPLPAPIVRLLVRHVAARLHAPMSEPLLEDLAEDLRAFAEFVADPKIRKSVEAAEGYFHALQNRPRSPAEEAPSGKDRAPNHH